MSVLGRMTAAMFAGGDAPVVSGVRDPHDDFWYGNPGAATKAGVTVTTTSARTVPVVRDCLQVLSHSIGGLSFGVFQKISDTETRRLPGHPVARLFANPNPETTSFEFVATLVDDLATDGDFFGELIGGRAGDVAEVWRLDPRYMTVERLPDRTRRFRYREPGRPERVLLPGEVWHIRVPPLVDNLTGTSSIHQGREAIGAALAVQAYAARFFANDATPPFWVKHPGHFASKDDRDNFLTALRRKLTGARKHEPGVLEWGMDIVKAGTDPEQAQFLETRKEIAVDVTRIWRIPPHKVGILDRATFSNIEHQSLEFVVDTLTPWLTLIEGSVRKDLIIGDAGTIFEFNVASLLRGDLKARYEAYQIGRTAGFLSVNEIRRLERMNGIGNAGDTYIEPMNMAPVGGARTPSQSRADAVTFLRDSVERSEPRKAGPPQLELVHNAA